MQMKKIALFLFLLFLALSQTQNLVAEDEQEDVPETPEPSVQTGLTATPQPNMVGTTPSSQQPEGTPSSTHYSCIIVGAGISGIAASTVLTEKGISHLMLEAKDHIGGRIAPGTFAGLTIDLGANFIHDPESNMLNKIAIDLGIGQVRADFHLQAPFYPNNSLLDPSTLSTADSYYQTFKTFIETQKSQLDSDVPLDSILSQFISTNFISGATYDRLYQDLQVEGSENGADLNQMSTFEFEGGNKVTVNNDYVPAGGWAHFLKTIFDSWCTPQLKLSETVTSVDYSGDTIVVTTNKGNQFTTNNLLYSPSLGTLKARAVPFVPSLPSDKLNAIDAVGFGRFQKLFVVFKERFWPQDKRTLHFIGQGRASPYVQAWTVPNDQGLNLVVFFVTGQYASSIAAWQDSSIAADLASFLNPYLGKQPQIQQIFMTRWIQDPLTRGAYSFEKVGTTKEHFSTLKAPIVHNSNRVWLIGEHTDTSDFSYAQGAYQSGESAAKEVLTFLSK